MTAQQADTVNEILRGYPAQWGLHFRRPTAGKSGTTDNFVDAWYMSYTPDWVVATWAGHTEAANPGELPMNNVFGTEVANQITVPFENSLTNEVPFRSFTRVNGARGECNSADSSQRALSNAQSGCPTPMTTPTQTPTPAPSPKATPQPAATPTPTETPTLTPTPTPTPTFPVPTLTSTTAQGAKPTAAP
jgi:membrane peptidoglycan carboxypeptidase